MSLPFLFLEVSEMKKSFVRILLSICVIAMAISCLGATAFADQTYTVRSGDTVYGICQRLGIDFTKYEGSAVIDKSSLLHHNERKDSFAED